MHLCPYIPWKEVEVRHEAGNKETDGLGTHLEQGLEVGIVIHVLQMRKLRFRKTLALNNVCKMAEVTVGYPNCWSASADCVVGGVVHFVSCSLVPALEGNFKEL